MMRFLVLLASHALAAAAGFALGVYALPILIAPPGPLPEDVAAQARAAEYSGQFRRDLAGSDFLHWGEGTVSVGRQSVAFAGRLSPGPDYKLYLSPEFVETEADFERIRDRMLRVGDVRTFEGFVVPVPASTDLDRYNTVVVWCESFGQFITAARYR